MSRLASTGVRNVSKHPDGYLVRVMRAFRSEQHLVPGHGRASLKRAAALAQRLRVQLGKPLVPRPHQRKPRGQVDIQRQLDRVERQIAQLKKRLAR